jgi:hypothetical protein
MAGPRRDHSQSHGRHVGSPHPRTSDHDTDDLPAQGDLATIRRDGETYERWQHKPTASGTARIWYYVHERTVFLEQVHTSHPNQTK